MVWHHFVDKRDSAFYANHYSKIIRDNRNTTKFCIQLYMQTHNYQFTTRLDLHNRNIKIVENMKILGTIFTNKLSWQENCKMLIQKVNKIMLLLKKALQFGETTGEMVHLWIVYC